MSLLKNKVFIISIILWSLITLVRIFNYIPWLDEAHAWNIAHDLNIIELFKWMKVEGHSVLWYLILMPFAKNNFYYPYSMQLINWIFCFIALVIFWKKAPFSNLIKFLITFSFPFLVVYSVYARCYSIGILLLFLLTALYKDKHNKPVLYSILLVLCANTSSMAMFGAAAFGILFLYDLYVSKINYKKLIPTFIILFVGALFVIFQMGTADTTIIDNYKGIDFIFKNIVGFRHIIVAILFGIPLFLFFKKVPQSFFFTAFTYLLLTYCFLFKYYGNYWNHYFYFIYLIVGLWLALESNISIKKSLKMTAVTILGFLAFFNWFYYHVSSNKKILNAVFKSDDSKWVKIILNDKELNDKTIIIDNINFVAYMLKPYNNYNLVNYCADKPFNYDRVDYPAENEFCFSVENDQYMVRVQIDRLTSLFKDESYLLMLIGTDAFKGNNFVHVKNSKGESYKIQRYKCLSNSVEDMNRCLYKIKKVH